MSLIKKIKEKIKEILFSSEFYKWNKRLMWLMLFFMYIMSACVHFTDLNEANKLCKITGIYILYGYNIHQSLLFSLEPVFFYLGCVVFTTFVITWYLFKVLKEDDILLETLIMILDLLTYLYYTFICLLLYVPVLHYCQNRSFFQSDIELLDIAVFWIFDTLPFGITLHYQHYKYTKVKKINKKMNEELRKIEEEERKELEEEQALAKNQSNSKDSEKN